MSNWLFALQLIPLIASLIKIAENLLGSGTGVQKKAFVKDGVQQVINTMTQLSTGGQKATWQTLELFWEPLSGLIDIIVSLLFPKEIE